MMARMLPALAAVAMRYMRGSTLHALATFALATLGVMPALAEMSAEELAKLAQNPVGNLISLPFQNNTNLRFGPEKGTQNILNIQPVIPISVNNEWNVITRTIVPVISMPPLVAGDDRHPTASAISQLTAFLSPANPGKWIWGAGPIASDSDEHECASSATRTGAWDHQPWCSTSTTTAHGCTACW